MTENKPKILAVGRIIKPQGIRGEVKAELSSDNTSAFLQLKKVIVELKGNRQERQIISCRVHEGYAYILFSGIADRNTAELLRGAALYADRVDIPPLPDDRHFICDIIGCQVITDDGAQVGKLTEVLKLPSNDVYIIDTPRGQLMVPVIKSLLVSVDTDKRIITLCAARLPEVAVYQDED